MKVGPSPGKIPQNQRTPHNHMFLASQKARMLPVAQRVLVAFLRGHPGCTPGSAARGLQTTADIVVMLLNDLRARGYDPSTVPHLPEK